MIDEYVLQQELLVDYLRGHFDVVDTGIPEQAGEGIALVVDRSGLSSIERAIKFRKKLPVILMSDFGPAWKVKMAKRGDICACVSMHDSLALLLEAIKAVEVGEYYLSPRVVETREDALEELSPRELQVFAQVAIGLSRKDIARQLTISANTVDNHIRKIMLKLDTFDRVGLTHIALREGLIKID